MTDEMKNKYKTFITKISEILGLGKPVDILKLCATTDLFFQSSENRITELEKACEETQELLDKQIEATYKLDKENAELRKDKKELCHSISEGGKACVYLNEQLTKAKELLKNLLSAYTSYADSFDDRDNEIVAEAEQFLKSEVEKCGQ